MAVTINDLLGNNYGIADKKVSAFPSFEEYKNREHSMPNFNNEETKPKFDYQPHSPSHVSEEELKAFEASSSYEPPKATEFQNKDYDFLERISRPKFDEHNVPIASTRTEDVIKRRDFDFDKIVGEYDSKKAQEPTTGLYEFTKQDNDRLSEEELMGKLEQTSTHTKSHSLVQRTTHKEVVEEKRARLNTKGKVIVSIYVVLMLVVAILIGVHAGDINNGMAVAPTSNAASVYMETVDYMDAADAIMQDTVSAYNFLDATNLN